MSIASHINDTLPPLVFKGCVKSELQANARRLLRVDLHNLSQLELSYSALQRAKEVSIAQQKDGYSEKLERLETRSREKRERIEQLRTQILAARSDLEQCEHNEERYAQGLFAIQEASQIDAAVTDRMSGANYDIAALDKEIEDLRKELAEQARMIRRASEQCRTYEVHIDKLRRGELPDYLRGNLERARQHADVDHEASQQQRRKNWNALKEAIDAKNQEITQDKKRLENAIEIEEAPTASGLFVKLSHQARSLLYFGPSSSQLRSDIEQAVADLAILLLKVDSVAHDIASADAGHEDLISSLPSLLMSEQLKSCIESCANLTKQQSEASAFIFKIEQDITSKSEVLSGKIKVAGQEKIRLQDDERANLAGRNRQREVELRLSHDFLTNALSRADEGASEADAERCAVEMERDAELDKLEADVVRQTDALNLEAAAKRMAIRQRADRAGLAIDAIFLPGALGDDDEGSAVTRDSIVIVPPQFRTAAFAPSFCPEVTVLIQRTHITGFKPDEFLADQLEGFARAFPRLLSPGDSGAHAHLDSFLDLLFPEDVSRNFFIAKVMVEDGHAEMLLRPADIIPRIKESLPANTTLCVMATIGKKSRNNLGIRAISLVPDTDARPFERLIQLRRTTDRRNFPLDATPLDELLSEHSEIPLLSQMVADSIQPWRDYLSWQNDLLNVSAKSFAYRNGEMTEDGTFKVQAFWENEDARKRTGRLDDDRREPTTYQVFELKESGDPWRFDGGPNKELGGLRKSGRETTVTIRNRPLPDKSASVEDCPWPDLLTETVVLSMYKGQSFSKPLPREGFVVQNLIGERALLNRQNDAIALLERGSGRKDSIASPYLMATLFDISQAAMPVRLAKITPKGWIRSDINDDQKRAVEVMLSTADISFIQGPPGTGKTTMIAEACSQFVRMGKSVLLASQSHLAVDNALERMQDDPEVRPLRLGRKSREEEQVSPITEAIQDWYGQAVSGVRSHILMPHEMIGQRKREVASWLTRAQPAQVAMAAIRVEEADLLQSLEAGQNQLDIAMAAKEARKADTEDLDFGEKLIGFLSGKRDWDLQVKTELQRGLVSECLFHLFEAGIPGITTIVVPQLSLPAHGRFARQHLERFLAIVAAAANAEEDAEFRQKIETLQQTLINRCQGFLAQIGTLTNTEADESSFVQLQSKVLAARRRLDDTQQRLADIFAKCAALTEDGYNILGDRPEDGKIAPLDEVLRSMKTQAFLLDQQQEDAAPLEPWLGLLHEWVADLEKNLLDAEPDNRIAGLYLQSANVVGVTCNENPKTLREAGFLRFDVVIVDEVSKATPVELLTPMLLAQSAILVGDHRQLPPAFTANREIAAQIGSDQSNFDPDDDSPTAEQLYDRFEDLVTSSLFRTHFGRVDARGKAHLETQYRMHPDIMKLINTFYEDRLICGLSDPDASVPGSPASGHRTHGLTLTSKSGTAYLTPERHVLWIDSSRDPDGKPAYEAATDGTSVRNPLEASLVAAMVADVISALRTSGIKKSIGVITFYEGQRKLLVQEVDKVLKERGLGSAKSLNCRIETIDRFQGSECDIIFTSLVRNRQPSKGKLGRKSNIAKFERINVAFSRARDLLIVIGAIDTFEPFEVTISAIDGGGSKKTLAYRRIIEHVRKLGGVWQANDIISDKAEVRASGGSRPAQPRKGR